jgi:splicing factor 3B subunit 2
MEARDNLRKQQEQKRQKTKTRERRKPKLGKMDLEYQALHDAFFRFQTEPRLTRHGDL